MFDKRKYEQDLQKLQETLKKATENFTAQCKKQEEIITETKALVDFLADHNKDDIDFKYTAFGTSIVYLYNGKLRETTNGLCEYLLTTHEVVENNYDTAIIKCTRIPVRENSVSYYYLLNKKEKIVTAIPESIAVGKSAEKKTTAKTAVKKSNGKNKTEK